MTEVAPRPSSSPSIAEVAVQGRCPRCGASTLFDGYSRFAPRCSACELDLTQFNVGDGPAAFLTLILGAIITACAVVVEVIFSPPFWVHILLWLPITVIGVMTSLRVAKRALLAAEYRNAAREGRLQP